MRLIYFSKLNRIIGLIFLINLTSCNGGENDAPTDAKILTDKLQQLVEQTHANYSNQYPGFPGGMAIRVIHNEVAGFGQVGFDENITEEHHFRGQSTTKTFTAAAIVLLYQRGQLYLDAKVIDLIHGKDISYLPDNEDYNIPFKDQITIGQLLNHTAGVYDLINHNDGALFLDSLLTQNPEWTVSIDQMTAYISQHGKYEFEPGNGWHYSNSGYQLLAKIIEQVSGKSYRQFMEDEFIVPLELHGTHFPDQGNEQTLPDPYLDSWVWLSGESINLTLQNVSANVGEGNIVTTAHDLSKFYHRLLSGEAGIKMAYVSGYLMACVPTSSINSVGYGMGLFHYPNLGYGHGGDGAGISVKCYSDPVSNFTVLVLSNCWNFQNGDADMSLLMEQSSALHQLLFDTKSLVLGHYK